MNHPWRWLLRFIVAYVTAVTWGLWDPQAPPAAIYVAALMGCATADTLRAIAEIEWEQFLIRRYARALDRQEELP